MSDDDTTHILDQADALIRRHRVFVAAPLPDVNATSADAGTAAPAEAGIHDTHSEPELPLLTEIVTLDAITSSSLEIQRASAIQKEIMRWLDEELPGAVLEITDGLADQLVQKLTHQAENELLPRVFACLENPSKPNQKADNNQ